MIPTNWTQNFDNTESSLSLPIAAIAKTQHKTFDACDAIADAERSKGCLRGSKTSAGWSCARNDMLKTFSECCTSDAP